MPKKPSRSSDYSEKLRDPRWQKCRLLALEAANWRCTGCGDDTATLDVHHRYYVSKRAPWEYPSACFQVLCRPCHNAGHDRKEGDPVEYEEWEKLLCASIEPHGHGALLIHDYMDLRCQIHGLSKMQLGQVIDAFLGNEEMFCMALDYCKNNLRAPKRASTETEMRPKTEGEF